MAKFADRDLSWTDGLAAWRQVLVIGEPQCVLARAERFVVLSESRLVGLRTHGAVDFNVELPVPFGLYGESGLALVPGGIIAASFLDGGLYLARFDGDGALDSSRMVDLPHSHCSLAWLPGLDSACLSVADGPGSSEHFFLADDLNLAPFLRGQDLDIVSTCVSRGELCVVALHEQSVVALGRDGRIRSTLVEGNCHALYDLGIALVVQRTAPVVILKSTGECLPLQDPGRLVERVRQYSGRFSANPDLGLLTGVAENGLVVVAILRRGSR